MIVLDDSFDLRNTSKHQQACSSSSNELYVDDTVPYTDQLSEALNSDIESGVSSISSSSASSSSSSTSEVPAPLPPSYEASVHTPRDIFKGFSKRTKRRWLLPLAVVVLYLIASAAFLIPWMAKRHRQSKSSKKDRSPDWRPAINTPWPPFLPEDDPTDPSSVLPPPLPTGTPPIFTVPHDRLATSTNCTSWDADKKDSEDTPAGSVTYRFPLQDAIFITNNPRRGLLGRASAGSLLVRMNEDPDETEVVLDVTAKFTKEKCKKTAEVCMIQSEDTSSLYISVTDDGKKDRWSPVLFDITLNLPHSAGLHVRNLSTHLSFFEHNFDDLRNSLTFGNINIRGAYSPFASKGLVVEDLTVWTTVKAISGEISASRSLSLTTTLAPISVEVNLTAVPASQKATTFSMSTSNSPITSNIVLHQYPGEKTLDKPRYSGMITTANGELKLSVMHSKDVSEAELALMADTSLQPISLILDPSYEGGFEVKTKVASANVYDHAQEDPAGLDRHREIVLDGRGAWATGGWVGWNRRPASSVGQSHVELSTELADATLTFGSASS